MAAIERRKLVAMLASGFKNTQIAAALGVTDSAVTQVLQADPSILAEANESSQFRKIDSHLNDIEELAAKKLRTLIAFEDNPMKVAQVLKIANSARRRTSSVDTAAAATPAVVQLNLPERFVGKLTIETNQNNEVIQVGDRPMISMPASQLLREVKNKELPAPDTVLEVIADPENANVSNSPTTKIADVL